jgi:hypothetical protein
MKNALSILILEFFAGCDHHNNTKGIFIERMYDVEARQAE